MSTRTVSVAYYPQREVPLVEFTITNNRLRKKTLEDKFPGATGLEYYLDGVRTAASVTNDEFCLPENVNQFVVINSVYTLDGQHSEFHHCRSEITNALTQTPPRKLAVFIGNTNFLGDRHPLHGSRTDVDVMSMMFSSPPFNFTVLKCLDFKVEQMKTIISNAVNLCTANTEAFLCFVSTHGYVSLTESHQMLKGVDNTYVRLQDLMEPVSPKVRGPISASTPRVFFINACRIPGGHDADDEPDGGVELNVHHESAEHGGEERGAGNSEGGGKGDLEDSGRSRFRSGGPLPQNTTNYSMDSHQLAQYCPPNCLLVYGCPVGQGITDCVPFVTERISWLVHSLREVRKTKPEEPVDLLNLLTEANAYCCRELESLGRKYIFVLEHRLTSEKGLVFSY
ncbi:uncharacterized protein LOC117317156 [Pecten maximus]|uniref:uncharacterized protein LOC117317156 n=1 Tax=Pecten maximus TaxID=6579 RepID=UPI001458B6B3|nr:uncharacterized protein LOC117317156 [Pecten maximus]